MADKANQPPANPQQTNQPMQGNPLEMLLQMLLGGAQARPDLGQQQPVATMAGRVVQPGDTTQSALSRMPMGNGEGDPLQATMQAAAGPLMQGGSQMLLQRLLPLLAGTLRLQNPGSVRPPYPDNWGPQREPAQRGQFQQPQPTSIPAPEPAPNRQLPPWQTERLNPQQQTEYNNLAPQGRSQTVPEDIRRRGMGEQTGPSMEVPGQQRFPGHQTGDMYMLWKTIAKQMNIPIAE